MLLRFQQGYWEAYNYLFYGRIFEIIIISYKCGLIDEYGYWEAFGNYPAKRKDKMPLN
jgi:hypothetical protein